MHSGADHARGSTVDNGVFTHSGADHETGSAGENGVFMHSSADHETGSTTETGSENGDSMHSGSVQRGFESATPQPMFNLTHAAHGWLCLCSPMSFRHCASKRET